MRNGRDRRPKTRRTRSPKVALLKISMDSVQYNTSQGTVESMMTQMMSTARLGVAETACPVGVLCADSMNMCMSAW